ncbi:MAG TPA: hypothetical protein VIH59_03985 [Candidatus Tectomicrobia bacterium]
MAISADIAPVHPAVVRTLGMRTKVTSRLDVATTPSSETHARRRCAGHLRMELNFWLTERARRLARIPDKGFGVALTSIRSRRRGSRLAGAPTLTTQKNQ